MLRHKPVSVPIMTEAPSVLVEISFSFQCSSLPSIAVSMAWRSAGMVSTEGKTSYINHFLLNHTQIWEYRRQENTGEYKRIQKNTEEYKGIQENTGECTGNVGEFNTKRIEEQKHREYLRIMYRSFRYTLLTLHTGLTLILLPICPLAQTYPCYQQNGG